MYIANVNVMNQSSEDHLPHTSPSSLESADALVTWNRPSGYSASTPVVLTVASHNAVWVDLLLLRCGEVFHHGTGVQPIWTGHGGDQTEQQEQSRLHLGSQVNGRAVSYEK